MNFKHALPLSILAAAIFATACSDSSNRRAPAPDPEPEPEPSDVVSYQATLHRTAGGVAHVIAEDFGGLGYGTGYAAAQDNFCDLAQDMLRFRAELALRLGASQENLDSDFFYQLLADEGYYGHEIDPEMDTQFAGYAAGFNRYLRDTGVDNLPDPSCAGADWIQPITADDVRRVHLTPIFLPNLAFYILPAKPPEGVAKLEQPKKPSLEEMMRERQQIAALTRSIHNPEDHGSNGVAIGRDLSSNGMGILYTNPHLGWNGFDFRNYAMHQIIPGVTNLLGSNLANRANIGYYTNGEVSWTSTVSTSRQYAFFRLELVSGDPMTYLFDGEPLSIESIPVTVEGKDEEGNVSEYSHTFYQSHHGLMMGGAFPWGYSLRIANEGARGVQGGALAFSRATNVRDLKVSHNKYQSLPVNLIAVDRGGETLYGDLGPVMNYTEEQLQDCAFAGPVFWGNRSECEWNTDEDSAAPGLLGASKQAFLFRTDYVTNSNNSYWLSNPNEPLTGFPLVQCDVETERTLRTRSGLSMIARRQDGSDGLGGNLFDLDTLAERMLSNENMAGRLLRDDLVTLCEANPTVDLGGEDVDISPACSVLANWDLHSNLESRGAHLFREFMRAANDGGNRSSGIPAALKVAVPFDVNDPINTPKGLDTEDNPTALSALAFAVKRLNDSDIALDAQLGDIQYVERNGERIPMHGGEEVEGVFNKMSLNFVEGVGYPEVTGSSASWIMSVQFTENGGVAAKGLLARSQSANPESPYYSDMTKLLSEKKLLDLPYSQEEVEAASIEETTLSEGTADCADDGWQAIMDPLFDDEQACRDYFVKVEEDRVTDFVTEI